MLDEKTKFIYSIFTKIHALACLSSIKTQNDVSWSTFYVVNLRLVAHGRNVAFQVQKREIQQVTD